MMTVTFKNILTSKEDHIGIVSLNRPTVLNALSHDLMAELVQALEEFDRDEEVRAIVLTGSMPILAESFKTSLKPGGRLLAVIGEPPVMEAQLITSVGAGAYNSFGLFETCIAPLRNAPRPERFVF